MEIKEKPRISVIICVYTVERLNDIREAVQSVLAQSLKPHEVIVCVDHNQELCQALKGKLPAKVKIIKNNGAHGLSETRNVGIRAASGDIIAFIDDDAIAEKNWLEKLSEPFQDSKVSAVGGRTIPLWFNDTRPFWFPEELDWIIGCTYKGPLLKGIEIRNVPGCNMAFRKGVFEQAGFWGTNFGRVGVSGVGEEADFCLRLKVKMPDSLILYEPSAVIHHKVTSPRLTIRYMIARSYDEGLHKAKLKMLPGLSPNPLSTESSYLRYLLFTAIPGRLRYFYKKDSLSQTATIIISIAATGAGYLIGRARRVGA